MFSSPVSNPHIMPTIDSVNRRRERLRGSKIRTWRSRLEFVSAARLWIPQIVKRRYLLRPNVPLMMICCLTLIPCSRLLNLQLHHSQRMRQRTRQPNHTFKSRSASRPRRRWWTHLGRPWTRLSLYTTLNSPFPFSDHGSNGDSRFMRPGCCRQVVGGSASSI